MEKFQMSSHDRCGKIWNSPHLACVWCRKRSHICKIYAIFLKNQFCQNLRTLLRNPFGCNLRTFVWRKIYRKILYVEKKWQISGLDRGFLFQIVPNHHGLTRRPCWVDWTSFNNHERNVWKNLAPNSFSFAS